MEKFQSMRDLLTPTVAIMHASIWRFEHWWIAKNDPLLYPKGCKHLGKGIFFRINKKAS